MFSLRFRPILLFLGFSSFDFRFVFRSARLCRHTEMNWSRSEMFSIRKTGGIHRAPSCISSLLRCWETKSHFFVAWPPQCGTLWADQLHSRPLQPSRLSISPPPPHYTFKRITDLFLLTEKSSISEKAYIKFQSVIANFFVFVHKFIYETWGLTSRLYFSWPTVM